MVSNLQKTPRYAEFFCGGGMVRAALDGVWDCVLANDIDPEKCMSYAENWGGSALVQGDVAALAASHLHQPIDLYWASSPCQDFSLAGKGLGLRGARSGVFDVWISKVQDAVASGFAPKIIAFENVVGLLSRKSGADFTHVVRALSALGYQVGALEIDAKVFLPQSRPRLFVIAVRADIDVSGMLDDQPNGLFHTAKVQKYMATAPRDIKKSWCWWRHAQPDVQIASLASVLVDAPDTRWLDRREVANLVSMMSAPSLGRLAQAKASGRPEVCTIYKRGRPDASGIVRQRAELRFDGFAGCLRTPAGGSSRQTILLVEGNQLRARLLSSREVARLMGLPETYKLPPRYNQTYKLAGDGVAVPIVQYLDQVIFQAALAAKSKQAAA